MLRTTAPQIDTLWETVLPDCVRVLPDDLARLDEVLDRPSILAKFEKHWGRANLNVGRPSIPMETYMRMMALKETAADCNGRRPCAASSSHPSLSSAGGARARSRRLPA